MSYFDDVGSFHRKFGLRAARSTEPYGAGVLDDATFLYRYQFLQEELQELLVAHRAGNLAGFADALADLVYVALGTAHLAGVPFDRVWREVQRANMTKERATSTAASKRGSALDVVKPPGWRGPRLDFLVYT